MKNDIPIFTDKEPYVYKVIEAVNEGKQSPVNLSKKVRQDCVRALDWEGISLADIALFLRKSEASIRADLKEITDREIKSKAEYLTRMDMKISVGDDGLLRLLNYCQEFKRLPGQNKYQAITRQVVYEGRQVRNGKH